MPKNHPTRRALIGGIGATFASAGSLHAQKGSEAPVSEANASKSSSSIRPHPFDYIPAAQHRAIVSGSSTYDAANDLQSMLNEWTPEVGFGGIEHFPVGRIALGQPLQFPNWVAWQGTGRRSQLFLLPDHTGPIAFSFDSDPRKRSLAPSSQFNQFLSHFDINCNGARAVKSVIYAPSWNEKCGLYWILMRNVPHTALRVDEFHGGSAGWAIEHCEFMFERTATVGLDFVGRRRDQSAILNRPQIKLSNVTIIGGEAAAPTATKGFTAIKNDNVIVALQGANHIERAWAGMLLKGNADVGGVGLTGSNNKGRVRNLFVRDKGHSGQIDVRSISTGSAPGARTLEDRVEGVVQTHPIGARLTHPPLPGQLWAEGHFRISSTSGERIIDEMRSRGLDAVHPKLDIGIFEVTFNDPLPAGSAYFVEGSAYASEKQCRIVCAPEERMSDKFLVRTLDQETGEPIEPTEVDLRVTFRAKVA